MLRAEAAELQAPPQPQELVWFFSPFGPFFGCERAVVASGRWWVRSLRPRRRQKGTRPSGRGWPTASVRDLLRAASSPSHLASEPCREPSWAPRCPPAPHAGTGIPAARLLTWPTKVRMTTPAISAAISGGVCRNPRLTISVVAPVGGCEKFKRRSTAPVSARESEAAPIRADVTFSTRTLGSSSRPKTAREKAPAPTATACPIRVLRGLDVAAIGRSKKRRAVGPRDGKRSGCLAT